MVPKGVKTLLALIERRGKIVTKEELLEAVWPDTVVEESNLFLYLSHLRKTLGTQKDGGPYVETFDAAGVGLMVRCIW
jgi:DNA-binding winged helix-turn-helix (wHTH) protein